jgi:hypothetical protein
MLQIPYALNIVILAPVCLAMFSGRGARLVFEGKVAGSPGLELLVGALWASILIGSVVGLWQPKLMAPLLAMQVFYKSTWLLAFVAPRAAADGLQAVPTGIATCFLGIVLVWPFFIVAALR